MNKKHTKETFVFMLIATFTVGSYMNSNTDTALAYLGFFLNDGGGIGEQDQTSSSTPMSLSPSPSSSSPYPETSKQTSTYSQTSSSLQTSECYSPHGDIINSCNSRDLSEGNNTGFNFYGLSH